MSDRGCLLAGGMRVELGLEPRMDHGRNRVEANCFNLPSAQKGGSYLSVHDTLQHPGSHTFHPLGLLKAKHWKLKLQHRLQSSMISTTLCVCRRGCVCLRHLAPSATNKYLPLAEQSRMAPPQSLPPSFLMYGLRTAAYKAHALDDVSDFLCGWRVSV